MSADEFSTFLHNKIASYTKDEVIREISVWLWDVDEDIGTNRLQSKCSYWKFFNRIRLLLESDADYQIESSPRRLNFFQWTGTLSLLTLLVLAFVSLWQQSWGIFLLYGFSLYVLGGIVIFISLIFRERIKSERNLLYAIYPFESFADLLALRRSVPEFSSKRFPNKPPKPVPSRNRLIRFLWDTKCPEWVDRIGDAFVLSVAYVIAFLWFVVLWPLLVLLSFFTRNTQTRFVLPGNPR